MLHRLRSRIAHRLKTTIILYRPMATRLVFHEASCHYGVEHCLQPGNGGEFADLFLHMVRGIGNIVFVDYPGQPLRVPPDRPWKGARGADSTRAAREKRASVYSNTIFKIRRLLVGNPSNCELSTTIETSAIENVDEVRLARPAVDCQATLWLYRNLSLQWVLDQREIRRGRIINKLNDSTHPKMEQGGEEEEKDVPYPRDESPLPRLPITFLLNGTDDVPTSRARSVTLNAVPSVTTDPHTVRGVGAGEQGDPPYHVIYLSRRDTNKRVLVNERQFLTSLVDHFHKWTKNLTGVSIRLTTPTVRTLTEAVRYVSAASLLIVTHGAAMIYTPFLRPNAALITLDYRPPPIVPYVPSWVHWEFVEVECFNIHRPVLCYARDFKITLNNMRMPRARMARLLAVIDHVMFMQNHSVIYHV